MEKYNIIRRGVLLGTVEVNKIKHQPTYKITNVGGKVSGSVRTFKNRNTAMQYLNWAYPGAGIEEVAM